MDPDDGQVASTVMHRDWESCYQMGDTPWDKGMAAPPLRELIERMGVDIWQGGPVLVPGCGTGHDVREIASSGVTVVGLDLAPSAVAAAQGACRVGDEIYQVGDFLSHEWPGRQTYSALWEHTCFCAIPPGRRGDYAASAARSLAAGGILAGVFYLNPWDPGEPADGPPFGATIEEVKQWFSPWFAFIDGWVPQHAYPGREQKEWVGLFRKLPIGRGF